jgi:hypothetical protein
MRCTDLAYALEGISDMICTIQEQNRGASGQRQEPPGARNVVFSQKAGLSLKGAKTSRFVVWVAVMRLTIALQRTFFITSTRAPSAHDANCVMSARSTWGRRIPAIPANIT